LYFLKAIYLVSEIVSAFYTYLFYYVSWFI